MRLEITFKKEWKYKDDGELPKIHDFYLEDAQEDLAPEILEKEKVLLIIVHSLDKADTNGFKTIKEIANKAIAKGIRCLWRFSFFYRRIIVGKRKIRTTI